MEKTLSKFPLEQNNTCGIIGKESFSEISIKQFLDFLRTAYQVTDSVEDTLLSVDGTTDVVNWIKLKNTDLVKPKVISCQTSDANIDKNGSNENVKSKLDEILNEGILDSVLPYLVPNQKSNTKLSDKSNNSVSIRSSSSKDSLNKKKSNENSQNRISKTDSEVEIHVCDEVKNVKKNFICSKQLLVEKMGYFAEVTSGQKLEDMDISVHCDIGIFEWLMSWVKMDVISEEERPKLDSQFVVPILVSAAFLQMDPLLQDCLFFCHENMNEILQNATNFNCLNDSLITRLASMYTNSELESIKDKRDKIHSRLFCKMISSLCEPIPESVRGHWCSISRLFRCTKCEQLVMPEIAKILPCLPSCMSLNRHGQLLSNHVRDEEWNLNDYILSLQSKLKTWRKIYWRLWGDCHFLICSVCEKPFPANKLKWCAYHSESPQYFTVDSQKSPLPVGRYPCCGERAYRFQLINNYSGCQFREHVPKVSKVKDEAVFAILDQFREVIVTEPPELIFPERLTRLVARDASTSDGKLLCKEVFWWDGLQIVPPKNNYGLLGTLNPKIPEKVPPNQIQYEEESSEDDSSSDSSSSSDRSEECPCPPKLQTKRKIIKKKLLGRLWQLNLSARSNQDLQRANEENVLTKMVDYMSKKNSVQPAPKQRGYQKHITPPGGIYTRLEAEWREAVMSPSAIKKLFNNKQKIRATRLV